ncbi:hypothetical protein MHTCC0001_29250 [Flavobacteriaceae bacterium MHTCC 0001]
MKVIISHPTSNQNNRAAVKGLYNADMLSEFHTAIASFPGDMLDYLSKFDKFKDFSRRGFKIELKPYTYSHSVGEFRRLLASKMHFNNLLKHETGWFSIDMIYQNLDKRVANRIKKISGKDLDAVYSYEDCALNSFKMAKENGLVCLYDLPIGYWKSARKLLRDEIEKWPEWASTLTGFQDSEAKLQRKDDELALADHIFVASSFTAKTLEEYYGALAPISVIPYGFPLPVEHREYKLQKKPLRLLFVGGLSQRKGIANMFAAVEKLIPHVELTIVGSKMVDDCDALNKALDKHTWIPSLSHDEVLKLMGTHDVFLFPSLFEGFGLVITEAMSQGTPVITTDRTAGPDLIKHKENGWIVEAGSTSSLQECIEYLMEHPEAVIEAGKAAIETARSRPWTLYGKELAAAIQKHQFKT